MTDGDVFDLRVSGALDFRVQLIKTGPSLPGGKVGRIDNARSTGDETLQASDP